MITPWAIMPVLNCIEYTKNALTDLLAQTGRGSTLRVLVINQGSSDDTREALEALAEASAGRILIWSHLPPLPALAATWNRALAFVWSTGATEAWVVNNDVRLHAHTYAMLSTVLDQTCALFVSAVGVREAQFEATLKADLIDYVGDLSSKGGPDFSCFLLSKEGHEKYPFDEGFIPAYCEDLDAHRRYMLGGDGARIFSVNVPYLHYASRTLNSFTAAEQAAFAKRAEVSRAHYRAKWGGAVNEETYLTPFSGTALEGLTTPELQAALR